MSASQASKHLLHITAELVAQAEDPQKEVVSDMVDQCNATDAGDFDDKLRVPCDESM